MEMVLLIQVKVDQVVVQHNQVAQVQRVKVILVEQDLLQAQLELLQMQEGLVVAAVLVL